MKQNGVRVVLGIRGKNKAMRIRTLFLFFLFFLSISAQANKKKTVQKIETVSQKQVRSLSENDQHVFDYYFQEAVKLRQQGKYDAAFDLFRYCVSLDSLDAQALYETAVFYGNLKLADLGVGAMSKAYSLDSANEWYAFGLANMYISLNMIPKAIKLYEGLRRIRPDDENLLYQLANLYTQSNDLKSAIRTYDKVESMVGKNENVSFEKYKLYKQINDTKKAIHEIETLCAAFPYDVEYTLLLGDAWMDLEDYPKALAQYKVALAMDHENPAVALSLADYYNETGDTLAAQNQLNLALTNPNTDIDTKLSIFKPILISAQQTADSLKVPGYFDILLEQHPNEYKIRALHVQWLLQKGKKKEAKEELRVVLDLNPNQLDAWKNYLELNLEALNKIEIRKICSDALIYFPKEPLFWFYAGLSWMSEDENKPVGKEVHLKIIEAFQRSIDLSKPEDIEFISRVYGLIGDSYLSQKNKDSAFNYYEKALNVYGGNLLVLNNYAYYLSEDPDSLYKAERMSRKTIDVEPKNSTFLDTFAWIFFKEAKYGLAKIYIERAIANETETNSVILEHYGDILWFNGELDAARIQWKKALDLQEPSAILLKKVQTGKYVKP